MTDICQNIGNLKYLMRNKHKTSFWLSHYIGSVQLNCCQRVELVGYGNMGDY